MIEGSGIQDEEASRTGSETAGWTLPLQPPLAALPPLGAASAFLCFSLVGASEAWTNQNSPRVSSSLLWKAGRGEPMGVGGPAELRPDPRLAAAAGSVQARLAGRGDGSGLGRTWRSPAGAMWSAGRGRPAGAALLGLLLALLVPGSGAAKTGTGVVTCGSVLKLFNTQHRVRLHSHDVKYGSGARGLGRGIARGRGPLGGWVTVRVRSPGSGSSDWRDWGTEDHKDRRWRAASLGGERVVGELRAQGLGVHPGTRGGSRRGAVRASGWRWSRRRYGGRAEGSRVPGLTATLRVGWRVARRQRPAVGDRRGGV